MGHKSNKRRSKVVVKAVAKQAVAKTSAKVRADEIAKFRRFQEMTEEEKKEKLNKASTIMQMVYLLAQVQNDFIEIAMKEYDAIGKKQTQQNKLLFKTFNDTLKKLKGQAAALAWTITGISEEAATNYYRDVDYLDELIPLFLDRIGQDSRTDYVAQCILQNIYEGYTSKHGIFDKWGFKHLTRSKEEAERMRQINRWKRNQREIKKAVIAGRTPPAELPFPYPELDKQNYIDFDE